MSPKDHPKGEHRIGCVVRAFCMLLAIAICGVARAAPPPSERVAFDSLDADPLAGAVRITGLLHKPDAPAPAQGFPAVVVLHGCAGMYSTAPGREDRLSPHAAMWARTLLADGYAVLFADSFNPRGQKEVCTVPYGARTIRPAARRLDALGALRWLGTQPSIDRERIALLGFSHGGSTLLATINARDARVDRVRTAPGAAPFFRAAVAYYPGCRASLDAGERWEPAVPARVFIGADDDWTPAAPCVALAAAQKARGAAFDVTVYPGSYHVFDTPARRAFVRKDVPNGVNPGAGVTIGPNAEAAADARAKMREFLRERLAVAPQPGDDAPGPP